MEKQNDSAINEPNLEQCAHMLAACACLNLRKASRTITQMYDEALRPSGLRSTQLPVLITLVSIGPMTINHLADDLAMDRTSLSRLLQPLVNRGLIKAAPGADRRTRDLSITAQGRQIAAEAMPMWEGVQDEVMKRFGRSRWRSLIDNLTVVADLAGK